MHSVTLGGPIVSLRYAVRISNLTLYTPNSRGGGKLHNNVICHIQYDNIDEVNIFSSAGIILNE